MRKRFDEQLNMLHDELTMMGALCETAIAGAAKALLTGDAELTNEVLAADAQIDKKERDIESLCLKLLLQQQPVASDLRRISAALKMITDMERIGDQASDIAEMLRRGMPLQSEAGHVPGMARATIAMVTKSVEAFVHTDEKLAQSVIDADDEVDALFDNVKNDLVAAATAAPQQVEAAVDMLLIAKYFERIGDHATNIAEWVLFSITGEHPESK